MIPYRPNFYQIAWNANQGPRHVYLESKNAEAPPVRRRRKWGPKCSLLCTCLQNQSLYRGQVRSRSPACGSRTLAPTSCRTLLPGQVAIPFSCYRLSACTTCGSVLSHLLLTLRHSQLSFQSQRPQADDHDIAGCMTSITHLARERYQARWEREGTCLHPWPFSTGSEQINHLPWPPAGAWSKSQLSRRRPGVAQLQGQLVSGPRV